jgi:shikimate kinase
MIITLIGPMASGKSTIGQLLASELNMPFIDTDQWIEAHTGLSVSEIFQTQGEATFRNLETQALKALLTQDNLILATGGGIITTLENHSLLQQHATIIYLKITPETQLQRLPNDNTRPLLATQNKLTTLVQLQMEREPLYQALAQNTINVDTLNPQEVIAKIIWLMNFTSSIN